MRCYLWAQYFLRTIIHYAKYVSTQFFFERMHDVDIQLDTMTTETRNPRTMELDRMSALQIASIMNEEDTRVPQAIRPELEKIALVAQRGATAISSHHRIFYMGAGTSGRLGVLDAAECPPTFGVTKDVVIGLIAGGESALIDAVEGAEDSRELGALDLKNRNLTSDDIVVGLEASGRTN